MPFVPNAINIERMKVYVEEGIDPHEIALRLQCNIPTFQRWMRRFQAEEEGIIQATDLRAGKFIMGKLCQPTSRVCNFLLRLDWQFPRAVDCPSFFLPRCVIYYFTN